MEIDLGELPFDIDFHPSEQLVTAGLITGDLRLYRYGEDSSTKRELEVHAHSESCRAVRFISDGKAILLGSPDCSILATDVETESLIARVEDAHETAINRLVSLTKTTIATGDDNGSIKACLGFRQVKHTSFTLCPGCLHGAWLVLEGSRFGTQGKDLVATLLMLVKNTFQT